MDQDVVDAQHWHPRHERLPFRAAVERDEKTILSTDIKQVFVLRVFTNDVDRAPLRKVVDERGPRRAVVSSDEQVRLQIVETVSINCEITGARVKVRRLDSRDVIRVADARYVLGDVGPGGATVATYLNVTVVSTRPENAGDLRRLSDSHNVTVARVTVILRRHRILAWHTHDWKRVAIDLLGQIDRSGPRIAAVHRAEDAVAADIDQARVVR